MGVCQTPPCYTLPTNCFPTGTTCTDASGTQYLSLVPNTKAQLGHCPASGNCVNSAGGPGTTRQCQTYLTASMVMGVGGRLGFMEWPEKRCETMTND